jgi:hypothetical protein
MRLNRVMAGIWDTALGGVIAAGSGAVTAAIGAYYERRRYERQRDDERRRYEQEREDKRADAEGISQSERQRDGATILGIVIGLMQEVEPNRIHGYSRPGEGSVWITLFEKGWADVRPRLLAYGLVHPSKLVRERTRTLVDDVVGFSVELRTLDAFLASGIPAEKLREAEIAYGRAKDATQRLGDAIREDVGANG